MSQTLSPSSLKRSDAMTSWRGRLSKQNHPIFTGPQSGLYLFTGVYFGGPYIGGLLWNMLLLITGFLSSIGYDFLLWFAITLIAGLVVQFVVFALRRQMFRNPVTDEGLLTLFDQVKKDLDAGRDIELWYRDTDKSVCLSTTNPLFKAILFSKGAIEAFLEKQEKAKLVLAGMTLKIEQTSPIRNLIIRLCVFIFFPFFMVFPSYCWLFFGISSVFGIDISTLYTVFIAVTGVLVMILGPVAVSRHARYPGEAIKILYGSSLEAARIEVLTGRNVSDEDVEQERRNKTHEISSRLRTTVIWSTSISTIAIVITIAALVLFKTPATFFLDLAMLLSATVGFIVFLLTYIVRFMIPMTDWA
jgi:ABC-type multidrug transport system fused ATPase/permease subunit